METAVMLLTAMVALFGVTSAVLGFIAEGKRLTPNDIRFSGRECVYPANSAHMLAVFAILLLVVAQIIASAAGRCCGCCRPGGGGGAPPKSPRRVVGVVFSVLSWIAAAIAVVYYWQGAALNEPGTREAILVGTYYEKCYYFKAGGFVKAGVLSLFATSLGIMSGVVLRAAAAAAAAEPEAGVVIGLPQWPAAQGYGQDLEPNKFAPPPPQDQAHAQV